MPDVTQTHEFTVNGVPIEMNDPSPTATTILEEAKKKGAMPRGPENYGLRADGKDYKGDNEVNIVEHPTLITVLTGRAPVA